MNSHRLPALEIPRGFPPTATLPWPLVRIDEVVSLHYGKALTEGARRPGLVPVFGTNGRTGWHDTSLGSGPTVILGRKGMGNLGVEWCDGAFWVIDTAYYTSFSSGIDPKYFYYFAHFVGLNHLKDGTSNPSLARDVFGRQSIPFPPLEVQQQIAATLSAFDDKIDLNRRTNETLEAIARAMFKDWFVDFGPTRAKMEGRASYLAPDLWALFPEQLDEDGRPEETTIETLRSYADLNPESWSTAAYPAAVRYVDLSGTKRGYILAVEMYPRSDAPSRAQRILRPGDSIVGTVRPGNGSFALVGCEGLTGSTGFAVLRPKKTSYREVVYLAATAPVNIERLSHLADGGAYPAVRPDAVVNTEIVLMSDSAVQAFSTVTAPLLDRIQCDQDEIAALAAARDSLLPKLMSGELRVRDAEKVAEAAL